MTLKRLFFAAALLGMALAWMGCQSDSSNSKSGGTLPPHYVKGEGYDPGPGK